MKNFVFLCIFFSLSTRVFATSTDELSPEAQEIANGLRCPTCTGLSVLDSEAPFSKQIKTILKEKVEEGLDKQAIEQYFVARYGTWILRSPPKSGINLLAWILPVVLLVLGPLFIYLFVWRHQKVASVQARTAEDIISEMKEKLQQLRKQGG